MWCVVFEKTTCCEYDSQHPVHESTVNDQFARAVNPSSPFLLSVTKDHCEHVKSKRQPALLGPALELLLIIFPQLLIVTGALPLASTLLVLALAASGCFLWDALRPGRAVRHELPGLDDLAGPRKSFVGLFRGALMAATCIAILAVDFRTFPRRYAKAETFGTGYMDVGVGGVVLTAGCVSPAVRLASSGMRGDGDDGDDGAPEGRARRRWRPPPLWQRLVSGLRGAAVCWALGLARLLTTRAVDYQEHVGEYGVHWNFFDTIAVVALLGSAMALPPELLAPAAVAATAAHQAALTLGGLGPWVMSAERGSDFISLNKEGLVSCVGYWALYLWGAALGHTFHITVRHAVRHLEEESYGGGANEAALTAAPGGAVVADSAANSDADVNASGRASGGRSGATAPATAAAPLVRWWLQLVALDGLLWVALAVLEARVEPVSRRSCNAAYVVWMVAQCLAGMLPLALWQALATAVAVTGGGGGGVITRLEAGSQSSVSRRGGRAVRVGELAPPRPCTRSSEQPLAAARPGDAACEVAKSPLVKGPGSAGPRILQAVNCNTLPVFLAANLMTGAVNLSMDTLQVEDWLARGLLGAYITCVCGLALLLDARGWRLKL